MSELRHLIRSILAEELTKGGQLQVKEEVVAISDDATLMAFVRKLLSMAEDETIRSDLLSGRRLFRLASASASAPFLSGAANSPSAVVLDVGLVTEKDIADLAAATTVIRIGSSTRFTPLAAEQLRRKGIAVERKSQ